MNRLVWACALALLLCLARGRAQVIEFESNGLKYQTLTKSGVTIMFATLPQRLHDYTILQVAVSNGSKAPYIIRPEDFTYVRLDGSVLRASAARVVVTLLEEKGSASDVIKLVTSYENSIYGNQKLKSTNGYEQRSEEHTSELQSLRHLVCRLLLEKIKKKTNKRITGTTAQDHAYYVVTATIQ